MLQAAEDERSEFERARLDPPADTDIAFVATDDGVRRVACIVSAFGTDGADLAVGTARRVVPWQRCIGLVLAPTGVAPAPHGRHVVELSDGTRLTCTSLRTGSDGLEATDGGARYSIELDRLKRLQVASDAYAYLSDMEPAEAELVPQLDVVWRPRMDASVTGEPLRLDGVVHARGIGMHVDTQMAFDLDGGYRRFRALVGLDDGAGPRGSVVFRVLCDGQEAACVGPLTGSDRAREVSVDLTGSGRLELRAEAGDPLVLSGNLAVWAEARVVR
jgi:hypothetical protein